MQTGIIKVGAFNEANATRFTVWAPEKKKMEVEIGNKFLPMEKDWQGYWKATADSVKPGTNYKFRIDGKKSLPDPASCFQPEGVHGPSQVINRNFEWTDQSWQGLPLGEMIQYELHVGTFTQEGTFDGVIKKLAHLKDLGVNAIELMPLSQFPGNRNWGYDGVYPFAVQNSYGGPLGLKKLVNEAHNYGIAVILDVVYNHQGPEGNYFSEYGPYFTDRYKTGWGSAINFDDAYCDGVRNYYWQNALMWLEEFHVDGLRLDAVHAIWDFSANHFIEALQKKVGALEIELGRRKVLIAEFDLNNPRYISSTDVGGYGLDGQWVDEYHHALHSLLTGEKNGYYEDFGHPSHLVRSLKNSYVYAGEYSVHRKKYFGVAPINPYNQFVVFAQNHDQIGNRLAGDRLSTQLSFDGLKLAAAAFILSPHVPMLFMGEEYGEKNPFQYFISHTDAKLVEMVREGRKKEFHYFGWKEGVPDPQSEETFTRCKLSWKFDEGENAVLLRFYKHLISLRKSVKALKCFDRQSLTILSSSSESVVLFQRKCEESNAVVAFNFRESTEKFSLPFPYAIKKTFDSSAEEWNGPVPFAPHEAQSGESLEIKGLSAQLFEFKS
jgi:maltooligosyltrehalose trehalohydrolase